MATFYYRSTRRLEPRPGTVWSTVYIKQDPAEYDRLRDWLVHIAETIIDIARLDADCATWFVTPMPDFRKSSRGEYYSPQELITDMIDQMAHGRDITEAMIGRWNRLTEGTPWQIEFVAKPDTTQPRGVASALFA